MAAMRFTVWITLLLVIGCDRPGPTHWDGLKLICNSSHMKVAEVMHDNDGLWSVWGGNGAGYGSFTTEEAAHSQAESLVTNGWSARLGSKWLTCERSQ